MQEKWVFSVSSCLSFSQYYFQAQISRKKMDYKTVVLHKKKSENILLGKLTCVTNSRLHRRSLKLRRA
jgi:hypothetical protein